MTLVDDIAPFVEAGFAVHWLQKKKKKPIGVDGHGTNWSSMPVASLEDLRRTYKNGYNVGVRLGEPSNVSGRFLHVIDMDIRLPDLADEAWGALREILPCNPDDLPCVQSGSEGESRHLYFLSDKAFSSKKLRVAEGKHRRMTTDVKTGKPKEVWSCDWEIELFGTDKQVAMPPSIHPDSGKPYTWLRPFDMFEIALGGGPFIPSEEIEAIGVAESSRYAYEAVEVPTFKPGQLERVLRDIPLERIDDRDDWIKIGQALHFQFGGSDEGFRLWMEVSSRSSKFLVNSSERAELRRYRGFGRNRKRPITLRVMQGWANEARDAATLAEFDDLDAFEDEPEADSQCSDFDSLLGENVEDSTESQDDQFADFDPDCPVDGDEDEGDGSTVPTWVARINKKHAVAFVEGKTVILTKKPNGAVAYGSVTDLHNFYENVRRATEKGTEPITKAWMRHKGRASYPNGVIFAPAGGPKGAYNHWTGFSVEPDSSKSCELFLAHLRDVICSGNDEAYQWLIRWFAHMIQKPGEKPGTAVVLRGRKGTGKDTVGEYVGGLFPRHHTKIANAEHLYGKFNAHQEQTLLLHVEEGFWAGDKKAEGSLKYVITSEQVQIEPKGVNAFQVPSVLRVFISSNEDWVVPASFDERRFFVMNVGSKRDPGYYNALREEMRNGGRAALLHYLQNLSLRGFDVRNPPMTEGLRDQKLQSLKNVEKWWYETLVSGDLPGIESNGFDEDDVSDWSHYTLSPCTKLRGAYREWMREHRYEGVVLGEAEFGKRLRELVPTLRTARPRSGVQSNRPRCYEVPPLDIARKMFEQALGLNVDWGDWGDPIPDEKPDFDIG